MFTQLMYMIVTLLAKFHNRLLQINDYLSVPLNDKQMHFVIIGLVGLLLIFVVYPVFKWLAKNDHTMVIAWIYVFTMIIVLTFAIEIGQGYTHTGTVEMADAVYGIAGFLFMFLIFAVLRGAYHLILKLIKR